MRISLPSLLIALALAMTPSLVSAAPGIPHQFYGTVTFENGNAPAGFNVEAKVNGAVVGESQISNGKYGYNPDLLLATDPIGENASETITFSAAGIQANETATFENGGWTNLNLTIPGSFGSLSESNENTGITSTTVAVSQTQPALVELGTNLDITISASGTTNANIRELSKLADSFFAGNAAPPSGTNQLTGFEINISGTDIAISATITYPDSGIDENTIKPYRFMGTTWAEISPFTKNITANTITFTIQSAATPYAIFGEPTPPASSPVVFLTSGGGGGGGGGGGSASTPSSAKKGDATGDGKVDIFDFNTLMVNWGGGGSAADFDGNGKIDIFDFNLLMVNWSA